MAESFSPPDSSDLEKHVGDLKGKFFKGGKTAGRRIEALADDETLSTSETTTSDDQIPSKKKDKTPAPPRKLRKRKKRGSEEDQVAEGNSSDDAFDAMKEIEKPKQKKVKTTTAGNYAPKKQPIRKKKVAEQVPVESTSRRSRK